LTSSGCQNDHSDHFGIFILDFKMIKMRWSRSEKRCLKNTFFDGSVPRTRQRTKKSEIFFFHRFDPPSGGVERQYGYALQMQDIREVWCKPLTPMVRNFELHSWLLVAVGMIQYLDRLCLVCRWVMSALILFSMIPISWRSTICSLHSTDLYNRSR